MKKIYLDYNIINYLRDGKYDKLNKKLDVATLGHMVVFSPAHLEEIAVSEIRCNVDKSIIDSELSFLSKIAQRNSLRPINSNEVVLYDESPINCYQRVIENYQINDFAETLEKIVISDANRNPEGNPRDKNNILPCDILNNDVYRRSISDSLLEQGIISSDEVIQSLNWRFSEIKGRFSVFVAYVNLAANLLEKIGYYREKEKDSRSRLHDVSHIIYGAYCDVFLSADKKLVKKAEAIYSMIGVSTEVTYCGDFLN